MVHLLGLVNFCVKEDNGCRKVKIHHKGQALPATVITYDPDNDLALLKGNFRPSTVFPLSNQKLEILQDVYVA